MQKLVAIACLTMFGCSGEAGAKLHLAMIPKGTTHVFWKSVEAGARQAATELNIDLTWKGPTVENDRSQQIQLVQQFLTQGVAGILLAPLDDQALVAPVAAAKKKGLPVVIFDSPLVGTAGTDFVSLIATDNRQAGEAAGRHLAALLAQDPGAPKGPVVLLRYLVGSASTEQRENGFLAAAASAGLQVSVETRYAGASIGEAKTTVLNMLDDVRAAKGVFCSNEPTTMGMLLALEQTGLLAKVRFVGFDASPPLVDALTRGSIDALVVQNPRKMGDLAVRTMVAHLRQQPVETLVDTGAVLVTRANLEQPEIASLLR